MYNSIWAFGNGVKNSFYENDGNIFKSKYFGLVHNPIAMKNCLTNPRLMRGEIVTEFLKLTFFRYSIFDLLKYFGISLNISSGGKTILFDVLVDIIEEG